MYRKLKTLIPLFIIALSLGLSLRAEAKGGTSIEGVININTATAEELTLLPGVGPARAEAIVAMRTTEPFHAVEDLVKVKGIGPKMFEKIRPFVTLEGPTTAKMVRQNKLELETPTEGDQG